MEVVAVLHQLDTSFCLAMDELLEVLKGWTEQEGE